MDRNVAEPDNFAPDPVFKIADPDPVWIWPYVGKFQIFFVIFIPCKVGTRFLLKHQNNKE